MKLYGRVSIFMKWRNIDWHMSDGKKLFFMGCPKAIGVDNKLLEEDHKVVDNKIFCAFFIAETTKNGKIKFNVINIDNKSIKWFRKY